MTSSALSERSTGRAPRSSALPISTGCHGLYRFGCDRSPFETIRLGAQKHGFTDNELGQLVGELQAALEVGVIAPAEPA
jgi:hypothetical protein